MNKVAIFLNRYYWVFLVIIVLVSYGQMIWMQPWEDDNALFFKLAHIQESAGLFGSGPSGGGIYKYAAIPFIPIYKFFGVTTLAYFGLLILMYAVVTLVVYKLYSNILGKAEGKVAGFIFAAGYLVSDGFWRMTNSVITSISIILISIFTFLYWKYYKERKVWYYLLALATFFLAVRYSIIRDHYLFAVTVFFELIFFTFRKPLVSFFYSLIRIVPFAYIFYRWVILLGDSHAQGVKDFVFSFSRGQFYVAYGFLCSIANLVVPDYITNFVFDFQKQISVSLPTSFSLTHILLFIFPAIIIFFLFRKAKKKYYLLSFFYLLILVWLKSSVNVFSVPVLNPGEKELFIVALGGIIIILFTAILISLKKKQGLFLFLVLWLLTNTAAYSTYLPTVAFGSINRYLAHSFFAYVGVLGILSTSFIGKSRTSRIVYWLVIVFGIGNIYHAVIYQNNILKVRSYPVRDFYLQLNSVLPKINKGDILYFDVSSNRSNVFRNAVAAAMMPSSASFAWRYGTDCCSDLDLVTSFSELCDLVTQKSIGLDSIHSFWYSDLGLKDTSVDVRRYFLNKNEIFQPIINSSQMSNVVLNITSSGSVWQQPDTIVNFPDIVKSTTPVELAIDLIAFPLNGNNVKYPLSVSGSYIQSVALNPYQIKLSLQYKLDMNDFKKNSVVEVSSSWQDRIPSNLFDGDVDTVWQPDRVLWRDKEEFVEVKLPVTEEINRVFWIEGTYRDAIPTSYEINTSLDGIHWRKVALQDIEDYHVNHIVTFAPVTAKYVKMQIKETLGDESPMLAELRIIPLKLSDLDLIKADTFLENPFWSVSSGDNYNLTLLGLNHMGKADIYWLGDKEEGWQKTNETRLEVIYDGYSHIYKITIPAGGTRITGIKFSGVQIPGKITINKISVRYPF